MMTEIKQLINEVGQIQTNFYQKFEQEQPDVLDRNLRKFKSNDPALILWKINIDQYLTALRKQPPIIKSVDYPYFIESRIKRSTNRKLDKFLGPDKTYPVANFLNDTFGCRMIMPTMRSQKSDIENLLTKLRTEKTIYRINYKFDDQKPNKPANYHGIHIYLQSDNHWLPWEIQLWDEADADNNYHEHHQYEIRRNY